MTSYTLYVATNAINGKRYVGITKNQLRIRIAGHLSSAKHGSKTRFAAAIRKHGGNAFEWRTIAILRDLPSALAAEARAVDDLKPEYNVLPGGGITHHQDVPRPTKGVFCLEDDLWFPSVKAAARHYGISGGRVSTICKGHEISAHGRHFVHASRPLTDREKKEHFALCSARRQRRAVNSRAARSRPVICLNDHRLYDSQRAAAKFYGLAPSRVMQICQTGASTKVGLRFAYADGTEPSPVVRSPEAIADGKRRREAALERWRDKQSRPVMCDDGCAYPSATAAAAAYGLARATVWNAIRYADGFAGGRHFSMVEGVA